jgi:RNA polymerase sigma-70 factor (ECF subfamily)
MQPSNLVPHMTANDTQLNDRQLVERLLAGDERAFRGFFDEYFDRLYRFALSRTRGDTHLAEEAAQRALCRAVRRLDSYRGEAALFTWLVQICRNELADLFEAAGRDASRTISIDSSERVRAVAEQVAGDSTSDPAHARQADDAGLVVRQVLDTLPGRYAEVLEWKYLDELGTQEIAARLGTTFEAAQSTLQRARGAFRSALSSRGIDAATLGL